MSEDDDPSLSFSPAAESSHPRSISQASPCSAAAKEEAESKNARPAATAMTAAAIQPLARIGVLGAFISKGLPQADVELKRIVHVFAALERKREIESHRSDQRMVAQT